AYVKRLAEEWNDQIHGSEDNIIDVIPWSHKITLDIIGESAFNYRFDALSNTPNELSQALKDLDKVAGNDVTALTILLITLQSYIPAFLSSLQAKYLPTPTEKTAKRYRELSTAKARELMREAELTDGRDVLSVLVRANSAEDQKKQLNEAEILAQISTIIQAGSHTTAYTLSWILYELATHPADQTKVYEEIKRVRKDRGDLELMNEDYDSMNHLTLVLKETLRLHPVFPKLLREARKNDILSLDFPVVSEGGKTIKEIPIMKGQRIWVDATMYSRLEGVWGPNPNKWNPRRHEILSSEEKKIAQVGLFANVLAFSGGPKGCIGWRFALMELQALITGLIERFEFSILPDIEIDTVSFALDVPAVKGKERMGAQLPLKVTTRSG
ncbi:hypothetical protein V5O48_017242, partial [Marasmius crinis-equi]